MKRCRNSSPDRRRRVPPPIRWIDSHPGEFQPYRLLSRYLKRNGFSGWNFPGSPPQTTLVRQSYNGRDTGYTCDLCQEDVTVGLFESSIKALENHCDSRFHVSRKIAFFELECSSAKTWCSALQCKMDQLTPAPWQVEMRSIMFSVMLDECEPLLQELTNVENTIEQHEHIARVALLELAVLKAMCIVKGPFEDVVYDIYSWEAWNCDGWKASKKDMMNANEIGVVVRSVIPFLDQQPLTCDKDHVAPFLPSDHVHRVVTNEWAYDHNDLRLSNVSPVDSASFRCEICNEDLIRDARAHGNSETHKSRAWRIKEMQECPTRLWCAHVKNRVELFRPAPWTHDVKHLLFWVLLGQGVWDKYETINRRREIEYRLYNYECSEQLAMVQLAAWKCLCIASPPTASEIKGTAYSTLADWVCSGWQRQKQTLHNSPDIAFIIQSVRPFLGQGAGLSRVTSFENELLCNWTSDTVVTIQHKRKSDSESESSCDDSAS